MPNPAQKSPFDIRCTVNRPYLQAKAGSSVFVALDLTPSAAAQPKIRNISLAIDASASMDGEKMDRAKESAVGLIRQLKPNDQISVISFSDVADLKLPTSPVGDFRIAEAAVRSIAVKGLTAMYNGLDLAFKELSKNARKPGVVNRVLLLTDGIPSLGKTDDKEFARLAEAMRDVGITITAIGIGTDYNEGLLAAIANAGGGMWQHIKDPRRDLPQIFQEQVAQMASTVVANPELKISMMPGAELADAYAVKPSLNRLPRPKVDAQGFTIPLRDLIVGQEQNLVFRIGVAGKQNGTFKLLRVVLQDVVKEIDITFTEDPKQWNVETNPYPRMLLHSAEATVLMQTAVQKGDKAAMQRAESVMKSMAADPNATVAVRKNAVLAEVSATMTNAHATVAKTGLQLNEAAKKDFLHETTVIGRKKPAGK